MEGRNGEDGAVFYVLRVERVEEFPTADTSERDCEDGRRFVPRREKRRAQDRKSRIIPLRSLKLERKKERERGGSRSLRLRSHQPACTAEKVGPRCVVRRSVNEKTSCAF